MSAVSSLVLKNLYVLLGTGRELRRQSRFKTVFITFCVVLLEAGLFAAFFFGFGALGRLGSIAPIIESGLLSLFFMGLGGMLILSGVLTSYATIYRSQDIPLMLTSPYSISEITVYKFLESCLLSSWAVFFVVVPFVGAYAWHQDMSILFALWTLLFSIPFVVFCAGIGALTTLVCVRLSPGGHLIKALVAGIVIAVTIAVAITVREARNEEDPTVFVLSSRVVPGLNLANSPFLPSWWAAQGIMSFGRGEWGRGLLLFTFLTTNAVMLTMVVELVGKWTFFKGWQKVIGATGRLVLRKPLLEGVERGLFFLAHDIRAIVVKDLRTFLRDPMQWSQFLIFFGLLGIYFMSLRSFKYHELSPLVRTAIAFLNIFSVSTVLCSLASRFVYPQVSLEGQSFWILGLSPTSMGRILWTKFGLALSGMLIISVSLMFLSTRMLGMPADMELVAVALAVCLSIAISGMSTGVGAIFLNLRERNPAAIVSGFGGTLNLVMSLGFMILTELPFAVLFGLGVVGKIGEHRLKLGFVSAYLWLIVLTALASIIPLRLGRRSLMSRDY